MDFILQYFPVVGIVVFVPLFVASMLRNKISGDQEDLRALAIKSMRLTLGLILLLAGNEKLTGMPDIIGPNYLITELEKYGLGLFGQFIAVSQLVIGFVLLTNRFGALGDIMAFPMFLNILIVTLSLQWQGTPKEVALLLGFNVVLIFSNWHKIKFLITDDTVEIQKIPIKRSDVKLDMVYGIILCVLLVAVAISHYQLTWSHFLVKLSLGAMFVLYILTALANRKKNRS